VDDEAATERAAAAQEADALGANPPMGSQSSTMEALMHHSTTLLFLVLAVVVIGLASFT
jgi:hypothetical protein